MLQSETRQHQLEELAEAYDAEFPEVWDMFCRFALQTIAQGFENYSAYAIFEWIRWETDLGDSRGKYTFKLNNNYRPYYARWFMDVYPEHAGYFRTRVLTSSGRRAVTRPELGPADFDG